MQLSKHQTFHSRSKHIGVKHYFVRDVKKGTVNMNKIGTEDNPVNALTKTLPFGKFSFCFV